MTCGSAPDPCNVIERLNREIRRRTRVVGTFPDGNSALMLVCARLRHVAGTQWGNMRYTPRTLTELLDANPMPEIARDRKDGSAVESAE